MIRLPTFRVPLVTRLLFLCIILPTLNRCLAEQKTGAGATLPLSPTRVLVPGETAGKLFYSTIPWDGREYSASEGVEVLMKIIVDPSTDAEVRALALERLKRLGPWLRNTNRIPELIALYDTLRKRSEKGELLLNLISSEDPRSLALFTRTLNREQDNAVRLFAAGGLAQWNVRRGVAELVNLLESKDIFSQPARMPYVRDNALDLFSVHNRRKGWGFSEEEIRKSIEAKSDLDQDQKRALWIVQIKAWFAANKERFPDWKLGDPLPDVEPSTNKRK